MVPDFLKKTWSAWGHYNNAAALVTALSAAATFLMTFFGSAVEGLPVTAVFVLSLLAAAAAAALCFFAAAAWQRFRPSQTRSLNSTLSIEIDPQFRGIGDYGAVCALSVLNRGPKRDDCLVQIEQLDFAPPDGMRVPTVLRTAGQIEQNRTGRFTLSKGQSKPVPVVLNNKVRSNEYLLFDELGESTYSHNDQ